MSRELIAAIPPNPKGTPFLWSVMIPCYNARAEYLAETLRSVLQQDPGPAEMQIAIVDDASPNGPPTELVRKIAGDRIAIYRSEKNRGLAGSMNRCIELAEGRWVHILHQDDSIRPGFYEKLKAGAESSAAPGLLYCRHAFIDDAGQQRWLSDLDAPVAGCLKDALPHLARAQMIQMPALVVRRSAYEAVGGFRPDLCFTLDWEMWCRLARDFPVWYEPEVLANYRVHSAAESARLIAAGRDVKDVCACVEIISSYVSDPRTRAEVRRAALRRYATFALKNAGDMLRIGRRDAAWVQIRGALKCDLSLKVVKHAIWMLPALVRTAPGNSAPK